MTYIALTIAGSDSSGGAGIQADIKTMSALGVYAASVITAITAQNTQGVSAIHDVPTPIVMAQIVAVLDDLKVQAIKIGMLSSVEIIQTVAQCIKRYNVAHCVLDPVMVAASGARLLSESAVEALIQALFPVAILITPNLPEAAALLHSTIASNEDEMIEQGKALLRLGAHAVLMKGGHGSSDESVDFLITPHEVHRFCAMRIKTMNTHGTGCSLASAITSYLAQGQTLVEAVASAKIFITGAISHADMLNVGNGHGPIHHFYAK